MHTQKVPLQTPPYPKISYYGYNKGGVKDMKNHKNKG